MNPKPGNRPGITSRLVFRGEDGFDPARDRYSCEIQGLSCPLRSWAERLSPRSTRWRSMRPTLATGVLCAIFTFAIGSAFSRAADNAASTAARQSGRARRGTQRASGPPLRQPPKSAAAGANLANGQNPPPAAQGQSGKAGRGGGDRDAPAPAGQRNRHQRQRDVRATQMQDQKLGLVAPAMQQLPGVEVEPGRVAGYQSPT